MFISCQVPSLSLWISHSECWDQMTNFMSIDLLFLFICVHLYMTQPSLFPCICFTCTSPHNHSSSISNFYSLCSVTYRYCLSGLLCFISSWYFHLITTCLVSLILTMLYYNNTMNHVLSRTWVHLILELEERRGFI